MINYIRKWAIKPVVILPLLSWVLIVCTGCHQELIRESKPQFSGEELFRGIFFFEGRLVETLPTLKENYNIIKDLIETEKTIDINSKESIDFKQKVVDRIREKNKSFFDSFKIALYSGNPYDVKNSILEGAKILNFVMKEVSDFERITKQDDVQEFLKDPDFQKYLSNKSLSNNEKKEFIKLCVSKSQKIVLESKKAFKNERVAEGMCIVLGIVFFIAAVFLIIIGVVVAYAGVFVAGGIFLIALAAVETNVVVGASNAIPGPIIENSNNLQQELFISEIVQYLE
jgi:SdpC family antimicrobial peptide